MKKLKTSLILFIISSVTLYAAFPEPTKPVQRGSSIPETPPKNRDKRFYWYLKWTAKKRMNVTGMQAFNKELSKREKSFKKLYLTEKEEEKPNKRYKHQTQ